MNKKHLVFNALALTAVSFLLRGAGMFFRIYLSNAVGAEGMGLHQLINSVYFLSVHLASGGIGVAVTRLVAECPEQNGRQAWTVVRTALLFSFGTGIGTAAALYFGSDLLAQFWLEDPRAALSLRILAPSLPFIAVSACIRGYLTAREKVLRTAAAQVFEQLVRMGITLVLLPLLQPRGLEWSCAAIVIGTTVSEGASLLFLLVVCRIKPHLPSERRPRLLRELLRIGMPVTARTCFRSVLSAMENAMIPKGLGKFGVSSQQALAQYGMLKGMALPVLFFPSSFITSVSSLLVSELAADPCVRNREPLGASARELTGQVLRYTLLFSIFVMLLFLFFSGEIGAAFYREPAVGSMIRILAPLVPFMYLESIVDGMLTALDQQMVILKYNMTDAVGRLFLVMLLLPHFGMNGFLGMMYVSNLYTSLLCIRKLLQVTGFEIPVTEWILIPLLAAGVSGFSVSALTPLLIGLPPLLLLAAECLLSGILYGGCLLLLGTVTVEELYLPIRRILLRRRKHA